MMSPLVATVAALMVGLQQPPTSPASATSPISPSSLALPAPSVSPAPPATSVPTSPIPHCQESQGIHALIKNSLHL